MNKTIRIEMPDGSLWDVPADLVAHSRAKYYADKDTGETSGEKHTALYKKEMEYTLRDHDELLDWASNNMNWEDVQSIATMYQAGSTDYQEGWVNGHKTVVESSNDPSSATRRPRRNEKQKQRHRRVRSNRLVMYLVEPVVQATRETPAKQLPSQWGGHSCIGDILFKSLDSAREWAKSMGYEGIYL